MTAITLIIVILSPALVAFGMVVALEFMENRTRNLLKRGYMRGYETGQQVGYLQGVRDARPPHWGPYR